MQGGKFRPGEQVVEEMQFPAEVLNRLLSRGGGAQVGFSPSALSRMSSVLVSLLGALGVEAAELKKSKNEIENALMCITPMNLVEQQNFSVRDAGQLLKRVPLLRPFAPELWELPVEHKEAVGFLIHQPQPLMMPLNIPSTTPAPFGAAPEALEPPKKRGRGRPPLRPKTEQQQFRTFQTTSKSAPIPDIGP